MNAPPTERPGVRDALAIVAAAAWRAQLVHLLVFVAVPVLAFVGRFTIGIVFLPMLLGGFGDRHTSLSRDIDHLRTPSCWVALAPCELADRPLAALPGVPAPAEDAPIAWPTSATPRLLWFVLWLVWFVHSFVRKRA